MGVDFVQYFDSREPTVLKTQGEQGDAGALYVDVSPTPVFFPLGARYEMPLPSAMAAASERKFAFNLIISESTSHSRRQWRLLAQEKWCPSAQAQFGKPCFVHSVQKWQRSPPVEDAHPSLEQLNVLDGTTQEMMTAASVARIMSQSIFTLSPMVRAQCCVCSTRHVYSTHALAGVHPGRLRTRQPECVWVTLLPRMLDGCR